MSMVSFNHLSRDFFFFSISIPGNMVGTGDVMLTLLQELSLIGDPSKEIRSPATA